MKIFFDLDLGFECENVILGRRLFFGFLGRSMFRIFGRWLFGFVVRFVRRRLFEFDVGRRMLEFDLGRRFLDFDLGRRLFLFLGRRMIEFDLGRRLFYWFEFLGRRFFYWFGFLG